MTGNVRVWFGAALVWLAAANGVLGWTKDQARIGAENHEKIMARLGGEMPSGALSAYVDGIGRSIVAHTRYANEPWTFTIVDSPTVNAFAVPGGYVYVTRGLLALANSEAELAAVIGHEIAHVTENHVEERQKRNRDAGIGVLVGTVLGGVIDGRDGLRKGIQMGTRVATGYVAQFSQKQEFEADERGIEFLARAGYDPLAQARFLEAMSEKAEIEARLAGKGYNPNRVDFFASHPATGDRIRRATLVANQNGSDGNAHSGTGSLPHDDGRADLRRCAGAGVCARTPV